MKTLPNKAPDRYSARLEQVEFKENVGPLLNPITSLKDLEIRKTSEHISKLSPIFETVMKLNDEKRDKKLIGFCGGAFTVLNYMIEGKSSKDHNLIKSYISEKKQSALDLIDVIVEVSIEYLKRQIQEGADYIQVFESWNNQIYTSMYRILACVFL